MLLLDLTGNGDLVLQFLLSFFLFLVNRRSSLLQYERVAYLVIFCESLYTGWLHDSGCLITGPAGVVFGGASHELEHLYSRLVGKNSWAFAPRRILTNLMFHLIQQTPEPAYIYVSLNPPLPLQQQQVTKFSWVRLKDVATHSIQAQFLPDTAVRWLTTNRWKSA